MIKVFVYGTLKQGFYNNRVMGDSAFVQRDTLAGHKMHNLGCFPAITEGTGVVSGELWHVSEDQMDHLNCLEGFQSEGSAHNYYNRKSVKLNGGDDALVYFMDRCDAPEIESGQWE